MKQTRGLITVSVRSLLPVLGRLRGLGIDVDAVLDSAGTDAAALNVADARIPHELALAVWREAVRRSGDEDFGIHAAEQIRPGAFDVLDYAIRSSATMREGLERLVRYHRILHDAAAVRLRVTGDRAELTHTLPGDPAALPRHVSEFIAAAWLVVARQATGVDIAPIEVRFRHPPPANLEAHRRLFRAPIRFNQAVNGLVLRRELLDTPLLKSDPGLCAVLDRHARELLERVPRATALRDRVRQLAAPTLSTGAPRTATIARTLHMSRRTLQRQLRNDGTSHRELVDTLRRDLALRYLAERQIAIAEVAFLLGFSEASAFHRAFKRWSGTTPATYRRSRSAGDGT
jgi:AraC-like DNA-binding protein